MKPSFEVINAAERAREGKTERERERTHMLLLCDLSTVYTDQYTCVTTDNEYIENSDITAERYLILYQRCEPPPPQSPLLIHHLLLPREPLPQDPL